MTDLSREAIIDAIAFSMKLIEGDKVAPAMNLLDQLLHRLLIDNAVDEKAEMVEWYGADGIMCQ